MTIEEVLKLCFDSLETDELINWVDDIQQIRAPDKGIKVYSIVDEYMPCVFEDGKLVLAGYESTRGALFQRGAFDGEREYSSDNVFGDGEFQEKNSVCSDIAKRLWFDIKEHHANS